MKQQSANDEKKKETIDESDDDSFDMMKTKKRHKFMSDTKPKIKKETKNRHEEKEDFLSQALNKRSIQLDKLFGTEGN